MSTLVTDVEVHSAADRATVTITRGWSSRRGKVEDLPEDMRAALSEWLSSALADAWASGWHEHYLEHERQAQDPTHPITQNNPFKARR